MRTARSVNALAFDNEDNPNDPRNERVTCPVCRNWMGLPSIEEADEAHQEEK